MPCIFSGAQEVKLSAKPKDGPDGAGGLRKKKYEIVFKEIKKIVRIKHFFSLENINPINFELKANIS